MSATTIDITENRHGGNEHSVAAFNRSVGTFKGVRGEIVEYLKANGRVTLEWFAALKGKPVNCLSGRFSELKKAGVIVECGTHKTSQGQTAAVYRLIQ